MKVEEEEVDLQLKYLDTSDLVKVKYLKYLSFKKMTHMKIRGYKWLPWSAPIPTSLSAASRSTCSAASATKETPAIAAFSHFLYAMDDVAPDFHLLLVIKRVNDIDLNGKELQAESQGIEYRYMTTQNHPQALILYLRIILPM